MAVLGAFGKVDILINYCAGHHQSRAPTIDFPEADWDQIIDTNLSGNDAGLPGFRQADAQSRLRDASSILPRSSTYVGLFEVAAYSASKAAGRRTDQGSGRGVVPPGECWSNCDRPRGVPHPT